MGDTPIGNLVVNLKYNGTEFHEGIKGTKRELKQLTTTLKSAKAETKLYGAGSASASKQMQVMRDLFKQHNQYIKQQQESYANLGAKLKGYDNELRAGNMTEKEAAAAKQRTIKQMQSKQNEIAKSATKMASLKGEYQSLAQEQYKSNSLLGQWSSKLSSAGKKQEDLGRKVADFGNRMSVVSAAIGTVGGLAVREAVRFESSFAGVRKTVNASEQEFERLSDGIREMAKEIPVGVNELNAIAESAGQLGIQKENILGFTDTMAKLGATTDMSATDAANSLARFANITGLSQDKFGNLGSAIVDLGNNFATTESEITSMATGLAGAGAQIGMSEADILGVSAALSSVGIASERGASSMSKALIKMATAAENGGQDLENFANIAGMTSDEFANMFKSNPTQALAAFVDGLGHASEKGETAVKMLEDMGIKEIRLRDTLLRAGSASDLFAEAIKRSNAAFKENSALNEEYEQRAKTFESQLTVFKNKLVDVAITMGNELLPVMTDMLDNSGPMIESIQDAVKWFAKLDSGTKALIGKLGMIAVAGGPVISFLGNLISTGGLAKQAIGGIGTAISEKLLNRAVKKGLGDITADIAEVGVKSAGTKGMLTALGSSANAAITAMGGMSTVVPILAGVAVAVGGCYAAWKHFGEPIAEAKGDVREFGAVISDELEPTLRDFKENLGDLTTTMTGDLGLDKPVAAIDNMMDSINDIAKTKIESMKSNFKELAPAIQEIVAGDVSSSENMFRGYQTQAEQIQSNIKEVYQRASDERRRLTDEELAYVEQQTDRMTKIMAKMVGNTAMEEAKIYQNMSNDFKNMTVKQREDRRMALAGMIFDTRENAKEQKAILDEMLANNDIDLTEYNAGIEKARELQTQSLNELGVQYAELLRSTGSYTEEQISGQLANLGIYYDEVQALAEEKAKNLEEANKWIAQSIEAVAQETDEANKAWNNLVFEDKEGKLKTNPEEFIAEIGTSSESWDQLMFAVKHADMTTNAKEAVKEGLEANGWWEALDPETKIFLTSTNSGATIAHALQDKGTWDSMTFAEKEAILNSNMSEAQLKVVATYDLWNNTEFIEKLIQIDTTAPEATKELSDLVEKHKLAVQQASIAIDPRVETKSVLTGKSRIDELRETTEVAQSVLGKGANFETTTNAEKTTPQIMSFNDAVKASRSKTVTFTSIVEKVFKTVTQAVQHAHGTPFHTGGLAVLGDGGRREPYLTPQGEFGVSPAEDTYYDLPRGTKVWSNVNKFKNDAKNDVRLSGFLRNLPKFANGTEQSFLDARVPNVFKKNNEVAYMNVTRESDSTQLAVVINLLQLILGAQDREVVLDSGALVGSLSSQLDNFLGEELI